MTDGASEHCSGHASGNTRTPGSATHRIYGTDFAGDFPFTIPLPVGQGAPALEVVMGPFRAPVPVDARSLVYTSPDTNASSQPVVSLYCTDDTLRLRFPTTGDFLLQENRITYSATPGADLALAQIQLLGTVFSLWLEERGSPVLHASTVAAGGAAIAFLSASQGGKSSLAAALAQSGAALMSDDLLVANQTPNCWVAQPGYPQIRMWPEQAARFLTTTTGLDRVHPGGPKLRVPLEAASGRFQSTPLPLRVIYLPQRRNQLGDHSISIVPVPPSAGLLELVRHSFLARMLHAAGRRSARLPILASLARSVQFRTLLYPSGFEHLSGVAQAVLEDASALLATAA